MVTYGETTVLVAVTAAPRPRDGVDFFPLSVDYEEKMYSVGKIPGSFQRRESRPRAVRPSREGPSRRSLRASTRASPPVMLRMLAHPLHGTEPSCGRTGAAGGGCRTVALR